MLHSLPEVLEEAGGKEEKQNDAKSQINRDFSGRCTDRRFRADIGAGARRFAQQPAFNRASVAVAKRARDSQRAVAQRLRFAIGPVAQPEHHSERAVDLAPESIRKAVDLASHSPFDLSFRSVGRFVFPVGAVDRPSFGSIRQAELSIVERSHDLPIGAKFGFLQAEHRRGTKRKQPGPVVAHSAGGTAFLPRRDDSRPHREHRRHAQRR